MKYGGTNESLIAGVRAGARYFLPFVAYMFDVPSNIIRISTLPKGVAKSLYVTEIRPFLLTHLSPLWQGVWWYLTYSVVLKFNCRKSWCHSCGERPSRRVTCEAWSRVSLNASSSVPLPSALLGIPGDRPQTRATTFVESPPPLARDGGAFGWNHREKHCLRRSPKRYWKVSI